MKRLYVFADFDWLKEPRLIGELSYESLRGSDSYGFCYKDEWLKDYGGLFLSDDLNNYPGQQYMAPGKDIFGTGQTGDDADQTSLRTLEQIQAYLNGVPNDKMIVLDLWGEEKPVWNRTDAYYGKPWIWCMLHNFGGRNMMFGNAGKLSTELARVLNDPMVGALSGIGAVPEGIEQNPMIYSLLFDQVWREEPIVLDVWLKNYAHCRYGLRDVNMERAWEILQETVYAQCF